MTMKDLLSVPTHSHSASDLVRGTISPARLPSTVATQDDLALKSDVGHTHDDRYYTETEMDTALAGKAASSHTHDDRYYTETEIDAMLDDTGWTTVTLDAGYEAYPGYVCEIRKKAGIVYWRGLIRPTGGTFAASTSQTVISGLDASLSPALSEYFACSSTTGQSPVTVVVLASGSVQVRIGPTAANYVGLGSIRYPND